MGLQNTTITFVEKAEETQKLAQRGAIALLLKGTSSNLYSFKTLNEAKTKLKEDKITLTKDGTLALDLAFRGAINAPYRVHVAFCNSPETIATDIQPFEGVQFDWFVAPEHATKHAELVKWVDTLNNQRNLEVKAVFANTPADSEYVVNFTSKGIKLDDAKNTPVTTEVFTVRVASALAGTPLTRAITNLELTDIDSVERLSNEEYDQKIDKGELVLFNDWNKVRFGRGVNSLQTLGDKQEERKKILVIAKMQMWKREVKALINANYLGKKQNTINEKMLLVSTIKQYNDELVKKGMILADTNTVDIDVDAQDYYLRNVKNYDTSDWTEKQIRDAKTDTFVFIKAVLSFTDAMEDIHVSVTC